MLNSNLTRNKNLKFPVTDPSDVKTGSVIGSPRPITNVKASLEDSSCWCPPENGFNCDCAITPLKGTSKVSSHNMIISNQEWMHKALGFLNTGQKAHLTGVYDFNGKYSHSKIYNLPLQQ